MRKPRLGPPTLEVQSLSSGASLQELEVLVDDFTGEAIIPQSRSAEGFKRPKKAAKSRVVIEIRHKGSWRRI